jgi:septum formation protein
VVVEPAYEELDPPGQAPDRLVVTHAIGKARSVEGRYVLGVDTTVALDGASIGKPRDEAEARQMLERLAGRTHTVHSGLCLRCGELEQVRSAATDVTFGEPPLGMLDWYLASGEWRDRAGGYAIQGRGAALVASIRGDYTNVVGLPVPALLDALF